MNVKGNDSFGIEVKFVFLGEKKNKKKKRKKERKLSTLFFYFSP